ncbi:major facilitator superfamily MFS_1, partial [mine drainage metagenome]
MSLLVGVWVDRHRRRLLMLVTNIVRALVIGLVPLLAWLGVLRLSALYGVALVIGSLSVVVDVAQLAYVPSLLGRSRLSTGNSWLHASASAAQLGGPGLAGVLVAAVTAPGALLFDAGSFCVSALSLGLIRRPEPAPKPTPQRLRLMSEIGVGMRAVLRNPPVRALALEGLVFNLFFQILQVAFIIYALRDRAVGRPRLRAHPRRRRRRR